MSKISISQISQTYYEIRQGSKTIGRIGKHADGWRAVIGGHEAMAATSEDAARASHAKVTGQSISDIAKNNPDFLEMKDSKKIINRLLGWLDDNAARHDGALRYSHVDLAREGWSKPLGHVARNLGRLTSLIDFACMMTGLPALGCTPKEGPFPNAWHMPEGSSWEYPRAEMIKRARAHRWSHADFERLRLEIQNFKVWAAYIVWENAYLEINARIKEWAYDNSAVDALM